MLSDCRRTILRSVHFPAVSNLFWYRHCCYHANQFSRKHINLISRLPPRRAWYHPPEKHPMNQNPEEATKEFLALMVSTCSVIVLDHHAATNWRFQPPPEP